MSSASRAVRRRRLAREHACPDCRSNVRTRRGTGPIEARVTVEHDDTCPWWRAHGAQPFSMIQIIRGAS